MLSVAKHPCPPHRFQIEPRADTDGRFHGRCVLCGTEQTWPVVPDERWQWTDHRIRQNFDKRRQQEPTGF